MSCGTSYSSSIDIVEALKPNLTDKKVRYSIKAIPEDRSDVARKQDNSLKISTIDGSSSFHALVFKPNSRAFRASTRLCVCDDCKVEYGSCKLFKDYTLTIMGYKPPISVLRRGGDKPRQWSRRMLGISIWKHYCRSCKWQLQR